MLSIPSDTHRHFVKSAPKEARDHVVGHFLGKGDVLSLQATVVLVRVALAGLPYTDE